MLTRVIAQRGDRSVKARVLKFCDRIWLKDVLRAEWIILRSLIIETDPESAEIQEIGFLEPFGRDRILEVQDASDTCLTSPGEYRFNRVKTLGYEVVEKSPSPDGLSRIVVDGIEDVEVSLTNAFRISGLPDASIVWIDFKKNPIRPGKKRKLRVRLVIQVPEMNFRSGASGNLYRLHLNYLRTNDCQAALPELPESTDEIPFQPILNADFQGGFDVFCYVPLDWEVQDWPTNGNRALLDSFDYTGQAKEQQWQRYTWRMRECLARRGEVTLEQIVALPPMASSEDGFPIDCTVRHVALQVQVAAALTDVKRSLRVTTWVVALAAGLSILSLILALLIPRFIS